MNSCLISIVYPLFIVRPPVRIGIAVQETLQPVVFFIKISGKKYFNLAVDEVMQPIAISGQ
jgi:hypothetical protein